MGASYYGLREQPFRPTLDPRYLYLGASHREAAAALYFGIHLEGRLLALTGPAGTGRTMLLSYLVERLRRASHAAVLVHTYSNTEVLAAVVGALGLTASADARSTRAELRRYLEVNATAGRRTVIVIDDAHHLTVEGIDHVRMLTDLEEPGATLVQIVLSGQPTMRGLLARTEWQALAQRIEVAARLAPLTTAETRGYIEHRLRVAGCERPDLFTAEGMALVAGATRGIPRVIDTACYGALLIGCALQSPRIDVSIVEEALGDMLLAEPPGLSRAEGADGDAACGWTSLEEFTGARESSFDGTDAGPGTAGPPARELHLAGRETRAV